MGKQIKTRLCARMMLPAVLVAAVVVLAVGDISLALKLGTWNIKQFGKATMSRTGVPDAIAQVISQYDLMVIQEVQDTNNIAIPELHHKLNQLGQGFEYRLSQQRYNNEGKALERYAVFFRPSRITIVEESTHQTYDGFTYPPYKLVLNVKETTEKPTFGMIILHTSPTYAVEEMNNLADTSRDFMNYMNTRYSTDTGVLIAGDLNAGSEKVRPVMTRPNIKLTHPDFKWLIGDDINTSINGYSKDNDVKGHDRLIVLGTESFKKRFKEPRAHCYNKVQNFPPKPSYKPSNPAQGSCVPPDDPFRMMALISDHYPVMVEMNENGGPSVDLNPIPGKRRRVGHA